VAAADVVEVVTVAAAVALPPEVVAVDLAQVAAVVTAAAVVVPAAVVVELPEAVVRPEEVAVAEPEPVEEPRSSLSPIATQEFSSLAERRISLSPRT
jgi:hypothetical protein